MKEKAELLKAEFQGELVVLRSRRDHYYGGNSDRADMYAREVKSVERLIRVLDVLINS